MNTGDVKSAGRVLDLLELFATSFEPLGVTSVSRSLGIPKSSAQGLLVTLAGRGYLVREGAGYVLPARLRQGGWVGGVRARLLEVAKPVLERMAQQSGESAFIGVLSGNEVKYLAKALSSHEVRYDASLSRTRPVHSTSTGLAILAHSPPDFTDRILGKAKLRAVTPHTITDRATIVAMLDRARRCGYAEVQDANVIGASGVAAPVFGGRGEVLAGLSIGVPTSRYKKIAKRLTEIVVDEAATLSKRMTSFERESAPSGSSG